jgi:hypothetical protein
MYYYPLTAYIELPEWLVPYIDSTVLLQSKDPADIITTFPELSQINPYHGYDSRYYLKAYDNGLIANVRTETRTLGFPVSNMHSFYWYRFFYAQNEHELYNEIFYAKYKKLAESIHAIYYKSNGNKMIIDGKITKVYVSYSSGHLSTTWSYSPNIPAHDITKGNSSYLNGTFTKTVTDYSEDPHEVTITQTSRIDFNKGIYNIEIHWGGHYEEYNPSNQLIGANDTSGEYVMYDIPGQPGLGSIEFLEIGTDIPDIPVETPIGLGWHWKRPHYWVFVTNTYDWVLGIGISTQSDSGFLYPTEWYSNTHPNSVSVRLLWNESLPPLYEAQNVDMEYQLKLDLHSNFNHQMSYCVRVHNKNEEDFKKHKFMIVTYRPMWRIAPVTEKSKEPDTLNKFDDIISYTPGGVKGKWNVNKTHTLWEVYKYEWKPFTIGRKKIVKVQNPLWFYDVKKIKEMTS